MDIHPACCNGEPLWSELEGLVLQENNAGGVGILPIGPRTWIHGNYTAWIRASLRMARHKSELGEANEPADRPDWNGDQSNRTRKDDALGY